MADSLNYARFLNPWVLHLQKLALELKCPLCLNLFTRPMLLPCNHIFCNACIPTSTQFGSECLLCKGQYIDQDPRPAPYMENMVTIYRSLDATFSAHLSQIVSSDAGKSLEQCLGSVNMGYDDKSRKEQVDTFREGDLRSWQSLFFLTANKRVQVPFNQSSQNRDVKDEKFNKFSVPRDDKCKQFELSTRGGMGDHGKGITNLPRTSLRLGAGGHEGFGNPEIDMNHVAQSSPGSPPSFGDDIKGLDDDSDQGSEPSSERYPAKRSIEEDSDNWTEGKMIHGPAFGANEDYVRDLKRQKKLDCGLLEMSMKHTHDFECKDTYSEDLMVTSWQLEANTGGPCPGVQPHTISDSNKTACAFCQSSRLSEATGTMLHYADGQPVVGDKATHTNAVHVHTNCIEWAPQVFYVGESVKNLEMELARAAKLKCSSCGLKGAALGCYAKSCRRSYHVPCAVEVSGCRWDCENFLLLCPAHSSLKFPNEKSKSSKHASKNYPASTQKASQQLNFWLASPNGAKEWVLCGSALSSEEKFLLVKFASMSGVTVTKTWNSNVTHVIAATDAEGACTRTLKVLMAILNGRWILEIGWIKACMEAMHPVDEEPYEVGLDNHGCCEGPKIGRLRALDNAPKLFNGLNFYFSGDFVPAYKGDLQDLIIAAGGTILKSKEKLMAQDHDAQTAPSTTLVVYNLDPPQGSELGEEVTVVLQRLDDADNLAAETGSQVIPHTWILESIAACKLQPFAS